MHSKIFTLVASSAFVVASFGAEAMPAGTNASVTAAPQVTLVAEGCGAGMARGPAGGCRLIRRVAPAVIVTRPVVVRPGVVVARPAVRRPHCGVHVPGVTVFTPC